ncbi:MAG TPA: redoxin domain-containing protein [Candidatus Angelobacter sp.]|nr:redoxin domain-containing protein [Candidatus Angelobacter sp.]
MKLNIALSACCVVLLAANVALIHQNGQLKARLALPPQQMEAAHGAQMPNLKGFDLTGKPVEVLYGKDQRKVLVLVYSPTCPFCEQNWSKWYDLMASLNHSAVRPVAVDVTSTSTAGFLSQHQLAELPVFQKVDPQATVDYHFQLTPQTLLIDSDGKVEKVWSGVLSDSSLAELKQRLGESKTTTASNQ